MLDDTEALKIARLHRLRTGIKSKKIDTFDSASRLQTENAKGNEIKGSFDFQA